MDWIKKGSRLAWIGMKSTLKATAEVVVVTKDAVVKHQDKIAKAGEFVVSGVGKTISVTGTLVSKGADAGAAAAYGQAIQTDNILGKAAAVAAGLVVDGVGYIGKGTAVAGDIVDRSGPYVGAAVGGAVGGSVSMASEALDSVAITESDLADLREKLGRCGTASLKRSEDKRAAIERAIKGRRKSDLLDLYVVGGVTLAEIVRAPARVPVEVQDAFEAAYPDLAASETFADAVQRLEASDLPGLVSGVQGKLFEMEFVDYLNDENLPHGLHAEMAPSATQPSWDIRIVDDQGSVVEVLQAKATESVAYVKEALERYPDVDVVSTSEVYAQLVAQGFAEQVRDGGIAESALESTVMGAAVMASGGIDATDLLPSALGLAVIGLSVFMDRTLTAEQRAGQFGERSGKAAVATLAAKGVLIATQTWWLGLIVGAGTHWLATKGRGKREHFQALKAVVETVERRERNIRLHDQSSA